MDTPDLFGLFVRPLHESGLRYMVSGSLASIYYGEPRLTMDVDLVLWKLEFFREGGGDKHLRDIRGMLLVNPENIDQVMLEGACDELGLAKEWKRAQAG